MCIINTAVRMSDLTEVHSFQAYPKKLSYTFYEYFLKLDVILFQDEVRSQDSAHVIASVAMNKHGRRLAWDFFKENWRELMNRYPVCILLLSP